MAGVVPVDCNYVYAYIKETKGLVPDKKVGSTTINWREVIRDNTYPKLQEIANLYQVCEIAQSIVGKNKRIKVSNGYRTSAKNQEVLGVPKSWHLVGKAIDITEIAGYSKNTRKMYALFIKWADTYGIGELFDEGDHLHVATGAGLRGSYNKYTRQVKTLVAGRDY
jgi:uncharacterized protein YcbK (DUF882 family)